MLFHKIRKLGFILLLLSFFGCSLYERYIEGYPVNLVSAKRSQYMYYKVTGKSVKLSQITVKYTGSSKNLKTVRAANTHIKGDLITDGKVIRIPLSLLKPSMKSKAFATRPPVSGKRETPKQTQIQDVVPSKSQKESTQQTETEILPGTELEAIPEEELVPDNFEGYDSNPYESDTEIKILPTPVPTIDPHILEEKKLREKYKDIMNELDS